MAPPLTELHNTTYDIIWISVGWATLIVSFAIVWALIVMNRQINLIDAGGCYAAILSAGCCTIWLRERGRDSET